MTGTRAEGIIAALVASASGPADRLRLARRLLLSDPMQELIPRRLLEEALLPLLTRPSPSPRARILIIDWLGGGETIKSTTSIMNLVASHWPRGTIRLLAFSTAPGVAKLLETSLSKAAAERELSFGLTGINRALAACPLSLEDARALVDDVDLVLQIAPNGSAGLRPPRLAPGALTLLGASDAAVLSSPDPEAILGELPAWQLFVGRDREIDALRFWVEGERDGEVVTFGQVTLGPTGDATPALWPLIDNARRSLWRVLVEPLHHGMPRGDPLVMPCREWLHRDLAPACKVVRQVPAGGRFTTVTHRS